MASSRRLISRGHSRTVSAGPARTRRVPGSIAQRVPAPTYINPRGRIVLIAHTLMERGELPRMPDHTVGRLVLRPDARPDNAGEEP
jgi:hypothetical protein